MADKNANLKFWGPIGLALVLPIAAAAAMGMADSCDAGFAAIEIGKKAAAGCGEFWLNRYQTLITGALSAIIAIVGIAAVLMQLRRMDTSNQYTQQTLRIAAAQMAASLRKDISQVIADANIVIEHLYAIATVIQGRQQYEEQEFAEGIDEWFRKFKPHMAALRRTMNSISPTDAIADLYDQFEYEFACAFAYFQGEHFDILNELVPDDTIGTHPAGSLEEVRNHLFTAVRTLGQVQAELRQVRNSLRS